MRTDGTGCLRNEYVRQRASNQLIVKKGRQDEKPARRLRTSQLNKIHDEEAARNAIYGVEREGGRARKKNRKEKGGGRLTRRRTNSQGSAANGGSCTDLP